MRLTITFLALCTIFASCKKDPIVQSCEPTVLENHSYDTIFPSDYIMAYPGSWWEYDSGLIDSCESWQAVPIQHTNESSGCLIVDQDMLILPEGLFYADRIAFNQRVSPHQEYSSTIFTPLFDTLVGVFYDETFHGGSGIYSYSDHKTAETIDRLDSMMIGSNTYYDVLHVRSISDIYYGHVNGGPVFTQYYWFAKNTGLIKWVREENGTVYEEIELVDHYIAPH